MVISCNASIEELPSVVMLSSPDRDFCFDAAHAFKNTKGDDLKSYAPRDQDSGTKRMTTEKIYMCK